MKTLFSIGTIIILSLLFSSCFSSRSIVQDDVYVMKNSLLPIDESLNDETSYASYRHKKNSDKVSDNYYVNDDLLIGSWYSSGSYWHYPYGYSCLNRSLYYGNGLYNAFGDVVYDPFTGHYLLNPNYDPYSYNGSAYLPYYYGFQGYNGYGINAIYPNCNYYYGGYYGSSYYPWGSAVYTTNPVHYGPRGSLTGFTDPSRRSSSPSSVKMANVSKPTIERKVITDLRAESSLTQDIKPNNSISRTQVNREQLNQRPQHVDLRPTESRPVQRTNSNERFEGRPAGREINTNPTRGGSETRGEGSPTRNPSEGNSSRGGNNSKPAPRRN